MVTDKYKILDWKQIKSEINILSDRFPLSHLIGKDDIVPIITIVENSNILNGYEFIQILSIKDSAIFLFKKKSFLQKLFSWL